MFSKELKQTNTLPSGYFPQITKKTINRNYDYEIHMDPDNIDWQLIVGMEAIVLGFHSGIEPSEDLSKKLAKAMKSSKRATKIHLHYKW